MVSRKGLVIEWDFIIAVQTVEKLNLTSHNTQTAGVFKSVLNLQSRLEKVNYHQQPQKRCKAFLLP